MGKLLDKGKGSSELKVTGTGIGIGVALQAVTEVLGYLNHNELSSTQIVSMMVQDVKPDDIIKVADNLTAQGDNYIGAALAMIMAVVYIAKRAVLKYFELKGQIAIEVARINAEVASIQAGYKKKLDDLRVEGPDDERDDINIS